VTVRAFTTSDEAQAWLDDTFGRWARGLTIAERRAIATYKGSTYGDVNDYLRFDETGDRAVDHLVVHLDTALSKMRLPEDVLAYRGFDSFVLAAAIIDGEDMVGDELTDRAYLSTTLLHRVGTRFLPKSGFDVLATILIPGGAQVGAYVGAPDLIVPLDEAELLLPRSTRLRITDVTAAVLPAEPLTIQMEVVLP
jgi:hypothetical protein